MGLSAIFLYVAGIALILSEVVVPGMICGAIGVIFVVASCVLGCMAVPNGAVFVVVGEVVGLVGSVVAGLYFLPKSRIGKALTLGHSQDPDAGYVAAESDESLVGKHGEVLTALRPAGTIKIDGKRVDAVSDGQFIDKGATIQVIEVRGSRVVVERVETRAEPGDE